METFDQWIADHYDCDIFDDLPALLHGFIHESFDVISNQMITQFENTTKNVHELQSIITPVVYAYLTLAKTTIELK